MYILIILLPLIGSIMAGFGGRFIGVQGATNITTIGVFTSFLFSLIAFYEVALCSTPWLVFDSLTVTMLVVVTGVSTTVHAYSTGYMNVCRMRRSAIKAVIVNRILLIFYYFKTIQHLRAVGKSAQLGPTPVSALIHAATMVTAGVFLLVRCSPLLEYAPVALIVITCIGAMTAFFAATTALVQNDLKRVIAYSTCSQLGYMVFACGISNYNVSVFHLANHAWFKALLFLTAGSVIHALADEQDMRNYDVYRFFIFNGFPFSYRILF
eukprot:GSMAST32.ASY1.ANO1.1617.1 assembled CDS